jgi:hypothetical protein
MFMTKRKAGTRNSTIRWILNGPVETKDSHAATVAKGGKYDHPRVPG